MSATTVSQTALRPITDDDRDFLFRLYASTREEELRGVDWSDAQKEAFLRMQFDAQHHAYTTNYPGAELSVVLVDGVPAGRLYLHQREDELRIVDVALMPAYRGRGLGGALLRQVQQRAQALGLAARIHVELYNPAQRLYARLGFVKIGESGVYHLLEWKPPA